MFNKKGIVINKLVMVVIVIFVLLLILSFIFKFNVKGWFNLLPSFSEQNKNQVFSGQEQNNTEIDLSSCNSPIGYFSYSREEGKWYIVIGKEKTSLYIKRAPDKIKLQRKGFFGADFLKQDVAVGEISTSKRVKIYDKFFLEEAYKDYPELPLVMELMVLDQSYFFEGPEGSLLCKTTKEKEEVNDEFLLRKAVYFAKDNIVVNRKCECEDKCKDYIKIILDSSWKYGIDPVLLLSIIMQESSCKWNAKSGSGERSSVGLMQIYNWELCKSEIGLNSKKDLEGVQNVDKNILCGAYILKNSYDQYSSGKYFRAANSKYSVKSCSRKNDTLYSGWAAALRGYVGWGCSKGHDNYVEEVMTRYERLKNIE
ncbi:MAG: transglycosylase SLT domain-containing protein [Candidatus Pacearchaeota archaeon]